jgi:hypothetical protein
MMRRPAAWRNEHVDEAVTTIGVIAAEQNGIGVAHNADVAKALAFVRVRNREIAPEIV